MLVGVTMPSKLSCRKIRGPSPVTKPEAGTVSTLHKHDSRPARRAVANLRQERTLTVMRTKFMTKTLLLSATKHSMMPIAIMCDEEENLLFPTLVSDLYESYLVPQNLQNEMNSDVLMSARESAASLPETLAIQANAV